eukprot:CAMPEP_0176482378 /NCGR_PEP_ID=MMETSP0200_2-20121128/3342_1 /TAXON_ID=947934 /ORGANISM="Chaetoceros sp., Strain GSL56" /LENGTH=692 /DNA_ID=CAMNT_0017878687 /DNA_START=768 /DNA_END=2846 /DNA_ORIENTATION=+
MTTLSIIFILIPCIINLGRAFYNHLEFDAFSSATHHRLANDLGKVAVTAMSYFLVPVSRQSVLLTCLNMNPSHAVRLHIFAGYIALAGGIAHGLYWIWIWIFINHDNLSTILPGKECWKRGDVGGECHDQFVNTLGIFCGLCFVGLGLSSLWWVRRNHYRVFYICHITFSIALLFGLLMHYNKMIWYLAPSILYYFASSVPVWIKAVKSWFGGGSVISHIREIPDSRGCWEIGFRIDRRVSSLDTPMIICGSYVRLNVPEISLIWHPFTIFTTANNHALARIIFRSTGPFTSKLSNRLSHASKDQYNRIYPKILVDGLYGSCNQLQQALSHETVVIVAGGVGIVSFISLFSVLQAKLRVSSDSINADDDFDGIGNCQLITTRRLIVHWICRDKGLIDHVVVNYLQIIDDAPDSKTGANVEVYIHDTSKEDELGTILTVDEKNDHIESMEGKNPPATVEKWNDDEEIVAVSGISLQGQCNSLIQNAVSRINYLMIAWGGLWLIQYFYENIQSRHIVYTRSSIALVLIAFAVVGSITEVLISWIISSCHTRKYSNLNTGLNHDEYDECSLELSHDRIGSHQDKMKPNIADSSHASTTTSTLSLTSTDLESRATQYPSHIKHTSNGRPNIEQMLDETFSRGGAGNSGIFLCGPTSLHRDVREAVRGKTRFSSCYPCPPTARTNQKATIYEEVFEL